MKKLLVIILLLVLNIKCTKIFVPASIKNDSCTFIIHGFLRSSKQLIPLGNYLAKLDLKIIYIDYPSTEYNIQDISKKYVYPAVQNNCQNKRINFVTHSAGGIIVRYFLSKNKIKNLGRVVMLAPPNKGSEVADFLSNYTTIKTLLGPILYQLRSDKQSFVNELGNPDYEFGVIAGDSSLDPISSNIIPGIDDGKVSIEKTKLDTMKDFLLVNRTHTFIMDAPEVQNAVYNFLEKGKFN